MSRHLGLDLGGTNIKWAVVERDGDEWRTLGRDRIATPAAGGPKEVVAELARVGGVAVVAWPGVESVGIGVPGLYYPERGATRFLVNVPGDWDGVPVAAEVGGALGLPEPWRLIVFGSIVVLVAAAYTRVTAES